MAAGLRTPRAHSKSRRGCLDCKRRRVKCDEVHPICGNCQRRRDPCSFSRHPTPRLPKPLQPSTRAPAPHTLGASSPTDPAHLLTLPILSDPARASRAAGDPWLRDLDLMHHFSTSACTTLAQRPDIQRVWRDEIPREATRHPFVMHGLLAVSALHKAHLLTSSEREAFLDVSAHHQALGLRDFTPCLEAVSGENWRGVYCFSSMVVLYVCCLPARSGASASVAGLLEVCACIRGLQVILAPFIPRLTETALGGLVMALRGLWDGQMDEEQSGTPTSESLLPEDTFSVLENLKTFLETRTPRGLKDSYLSAVADLSATAKLVARAGEEVDIGMVFYWLYALPSALLPQLRAASPDALLLLAYYCVFLAVGERRFWFLEGWSRGLLGEVEGQLGGWEEYRVLMEWPRRHVPACLGAP